MLSIILEITCRLEISIHMHVSRIHSMKIKDQKEKSHGHILVQMFCSGKGVLNFTMWESAEFSPLSSFLYTKFAFFLKNIYLESSF